MASGIHCPLFLKALARVAEKETLTLQIPVAMITETRRRRWGKEYERLYDVDGKGNTMRTLMARVGDALLLWRQFCEACVRQSLLRRLEKAGPGVTFGENVRLHGAKHIRIEAGVIVGSHVVLRALTDYPWTDPPQTFTPALQLGRGCFISHFTHISCAGRIVIGAEVMIADRCFISDCQHTYLDPDRSVKAQPLTPPGEIHIGDGTWIGTGVCILGNVRIGRHCVVGANAVVTHNLPDYSVAVGVPARIIKRYDPATGTWRRSSTDDAITEPANN